MSFNKFNTLMKRTLAINAAVADPAAAPASPVSPESAGTVAHPEYRLSHTHPRAVHAVFDNLHATIDALRVQLDHQQDMHNNQVAELVKDNNDLREELSGKTSLIRVLQEEVRHWQDVIDVVRREAKGEKTTPLDKLKNLFRKGGD
ncbi:hypothetical protein P153DRAFT_401801 [Dothidotthia symphoricarpi CBS 119687]|uniref:Uncharacterized protein n=1 Tax=Dothidotthia symphoricarpi CBS 119687 TaxID=1392245 RepID=A0A6A5ZYZ9_9PLEO|nr:uncharacterized protein P153DRAFT_401801 [Dothidotthia symphoricarpi CBS 119687]KAF2123638.1 hypothetical protein P153DRAFT_401801 [Dothidotthia symphoricarpi CBS 119687]